MGSVHEALHAAGIPFAAGEDRPALRAECARLARRMTERMVGTVGLMPVDEGVAVPAIAIKLGRALAEKRGNRVGVVDAHGSWPCAQALARIGPEGAAMAMSFVLDNMALITPRAYTSGAMVGDLRALLVAEPAHFSHLIVDLTGFEQRGEQLAAFVALDGVVLVARRRRTTTRRIQRWLAEIPDGRGLGVLLTGL